MARFSNSSLPNVLKGVKGDSNWIAIGTFVPEEGTTGGINGPHVLIDWSETTHVVTTVELYAIVPYIESDNKNWTNFLVVGGHGTRNSSEVVTMHPLKNHCVKDFNFPLSFGPTAGILRGKPFACGGGEPVSSDCYTFNAMTLTWELTMTTLVARRSAEVVVWDSNEFWLIGGSDGANLLYSTEVCSFDQGCAKDEDLPEVPLNTKALKINDNEAILWINVESGLAWKYFRLENTFTKMSQEALLPRDFNVGLVTLKSGQKKIIVAGGELSKQVLILDVDTLLATPGPNLPVQVQLKQAATVPYGNTFLIAGGQDLNYQTKILMYQPDTQMWRIMNQRMTQPRGAFGFFMISDEMSSCHEGGGSMTTEDPDIVTEDPFTYFTTQEPLAFFSSDAVGGSGGYTFSHKDLYEEYGELRQINGEYDSDGNMVAFRAR